MVFAKQFGRFHPWYLRAGNRASGTPTTDTISSGLSSTSDEISYPRRTHLPRMSGVIQEIHSNSGCDGGGGTDLRRGAQPLPQTATITLTTPSEPAGHQKDKMGLETGQKMTASRSRVGFQVGRCASVRHANARFLLLTLSWNENTRDHAKYHRALHASPRDPFLGRRQDVVLRIDSFFPSSLIMIFLSPFFPTPNTGEDDQLRAQLPSCSGGPAIGPGVPENASGV